MSVLDVTDLNVGYASKSGPVPAVRGVSFGIERGQVLGLAGESGCGKSTIGLALLRLLPRGTVVTGKVLLNGADVLAMDQQQSVPCGGRRSRSSSRARSTRSTR